MFTLLRDMKPSSVRIGGGRNKRPVASHQQPSYNQADIAVETIRGFQDFGCDTERLICQATAVLIIIILLSIVSFYCMS